MGKGVRVNGLAICAGIGGLELGLGEVLARRYRTVCYVEREAYAAAVLVARMEDASLDPAPVWDDLTTFDGRPWRGSVDLITAGLPCQPYSVAGCQKGNSDIRALWPEFVRVVREIEPTEIFIENVPPFLEHFKPAWLKLRRMGFQFAPPLLHTASECGAPHIRRRLFIFAVNARQKKKKRNHTEVSYSNGERCAREWGGWIFDGKREKFWHNSDRCDYRCGICGSPWQGRSPILRVDDGPTHRVDRLRVIGNAVVPCVAASAYRILVGYYG